MDTITPFAADVYLKYKCATCGVVHILTREDTESGTVICACGQNFAVRPIQTINVEPLYRPICGKKLLEASPKKSKEAVTHSWDEAVKALEGYGYKRSKVFGKVMGLYLKDKTVSSDELLIQYFTKYL